jgi:hypothetical protein
LPADLFDENRLLEIRQRDGSPQVVGEVADQQLVYEVDGPEDIVDDQQDYRVIVMPTDQQSINTQDAVN